MRILIAEDDKALGLFLKRGLETEGYRVQLTCDGGAAVQAFREEMPDLTILDLNMPVKDGEQVLDEVRLLDGDLPVLILTGRQEVDTAGAKTLAALATLQYRLGNHLGQRLSHLAGH